MAGEQLKLSIVHGAEQNYQEVCVTDGLRRLQKHLAQTILNLAMPQKNLSPMNGGKNVVFENLRMHKNKINNNPVKEYTYDACGRLIQVTAPENPITQLQWDYEDRLIGITYPNSSTNSFAYNPFGARVSKTDSSGTSTYFRAGTSVVSPVLSDGSAAYTPGISERRNNNSTFYHSDLKNTTAQTASNETVSGTNEYDAFGNLVNYTGNWNGPFAYGGAFGYQTDNDSGLMLLGHRYYDSSTGRFINRDPIGKGKNWYSYCGNNPLNKTDFIGLSGIGLTDGGLAIPVVETEPVNKSQIVIRYLRLRIPLLRVYHATILVDDFQSGLTWAFRAGSSGGYFGSDPIKSSLEMYDEGHIDWPDNDWYGYEDQTIYVGEIAASVWVDILDGIAKAVNQADITYYLNFPNSNTVASIVVENGLGFKNISPPVIAPEWGGHKVRSSGGGISIFPLP